MLAVKEYLWHNSSMTEKFIHFFCPPKPEAAMPSYSRLNAFQQGIFQKIFSFCVFCLCVTLVAYVLNIRIKGEFVEALKGAVAQGIIEREVAQKFLSLILSIDGYLIVQIIFGGCACAIITLITVRFSGKLNWAWPATLPKAIEFRAAMHALGVIGSDEQIALVKKHRLPVYIAASPLPLGEPANAVKASLYVFAAHDDISDKSIFERNIGKGTLCLDAEDYELIARKAKRGFTVAESALLVEKDKELESVNAESLRQKTDIVRLTQANEDLQNQLDAAKAREGKGIKEIREAFPLWQVAVPLIARLKSEGRPGQYTRPLIQQAFDKELAQHPELQKTVRDLLGSDDCKLPNWFMDAIRRELGNLANTKGGNLKA